MESKTALRFTLGRQSSKAPGHGGEVVGVEQRVEGGEIGVDSVIDPRARLMYMANEGNLEGIKEQLDSGADVNFRDINNRTALHVAVCQGYSLVVELLLNKGAEIDPKDQWGSTPLADAIYYKNHDVIKLLEKHGATPLTEDIQEMEDKKAEETLLNLPQKKQETLEEMLSRHRTETSQLQKKEIELKKQAAKGSKAEQKAKKKLVEEDISKLSAKLKARHTEELASIGYSNNNVKEKGNLDSLVKAIAGVSVTSQAEQSKPTKKTKRREKRAQEEAARERRIQEEQSSIISDRMIEDEKLEKKLEPLGLTINLIKPDGHCLYRAVEDQLTFQSGGSSPYSYQQLREMSAGYMRNHATDFLPFFLSEKIAEGESDDHSFTEKFENYCKEVESTALWGGQLELGALTHCLKKHILILSGSFPDVEMGKEYKAGSGSASITLSYHRHAFGLGEHYNSLVPKLSS